MRISDWSSDVCSSDLCVAASIEEPRFVLLGLSQGGALGIAYALRHPERVSHLVLLNAYAQGRRVRAQTEAARLEAETLVNFIRIGWGRDNPDRKSVGQGQGVSDRGDAGGSR